MPGKYVKLVGKVWKRLKVLLQNGGFEKWKNGKNTWENDEGKRNYEKEFESCFFFQYYTEKKI